MISWFRLHVPVIACLAILSLAATVGSSLVRHPDTYCHDGTQSDFPPIHNQAAHHMGGAPSSAAPGGPHCLVCHLDGSLRLTSGPRIPSAPLTITLVLGPIDAVVAPAAPSASQPPLRSPPASVLV